LLIDMHNHTQISSPDSVLSPDELIETARSRGLNGLCVTEHYYIEGAEVTKELGKKKKFPVFRGIEARCDLGDMLVFGYYQDIPIGIPFEELACLVQEAGGLLFAAHPFRKDGFHLRASFRDRGLDLNRDWEHRPCLRQLSGFEVANGRDPAPVNDQAARLARLARLLGIPGIGGSDAHGPTEIARAATCFRQVIRSESELLHSLAGGGYQAVLL
jgi:predicted metal-dependent phosphoesterase TrpH